MTTKTTDTRPHISIEVVEENRFGGLCGAVIVRTADTLQQTPWMIGKWIECARSTAKSLKEKFPHLTQEHKGFNVTNS